MTYHSGFLICCRGLVYELQVSQINRKVNVSKILLVNLSFLTKIYENRKNTYLKFIIQFCTKVERNRLKLVAHSVLIQVHIWHANTFRTTQLIFFLWPIIMLLSNVKRTDINHFSPTPLIYIVVHMNILEWYVVDQTK